MSSSSSSEAAASSSRFCFFPGFIRRFVWSRHEVLDRNRSPTVNVISVQNRLNGCYTSSNCQLGTVLGHMHTLRPLLYELLLSAKKYQAIPQKLTLDNGLRVEVLIHNNQTHLQLSREDEFPSIEEFLNILRNLPYAVDRPNPQPVAHSGRKFLTAALPIPPTSSFSNA